MPIVGAAEIKITKRRCRGGGGGGKAEVGGIDAADLVRVRVQVHQTGIGVGRLQGGVGLGRHLAQAGPDDDQQVGLFLVGKQRRRGGGAEIAREDGRQVVHDILSPERRGDGDVVGFGKAGDRGGGILGPAGAAKQHQRAFGLRDLVLQRVYICCRKLSLRGGIRPRIGDFDDIGQHVFGQGDDHGTGPARGGDAEGAGHILRHARRIVDLGCPFGDRAEHGAVVDFLKRFAVGGVAGDLAHQQDHRRAILLRDMDANGGVAGAGAAGDHADAGGAVQLAVGFGHIRRTGLVAGVDQGEPVLHVMQRVQHLEVAFTGHAIGGVGPVDQKLVHKDLSAGPAFEGGVLGHRSGSVHVIWYFRLPKMQHAGAGFAMPLGKHRR